MPPNAMEYAQLSDADLWRLVTPGVGAALDAFRIVVERHQAAVAGVAYSVCGDLGRSEDVAQESFWIAWRERARLADPARLRAWLCGIARRQAASVRRSTTSAVELPDLASPSESPVDAAVRAEEARLVWDALGRLPDDYREALVLYYREDGSVAEVAGALGVSEAAAKQRLARGRELLRARIADVVEGVLMRSKPSAAFTTAVVTGVAVGPGSASASSAAVAGAAAKTLISGGSAMAIAGSLIGVLGGLLGSWIGMQGALAAAESDAEKSAIRRYTALLLGWMTVSLLALLGAIFYVLPGLTPPWNVVGLATSILLPMVGGGLITAWFAVRLPRIKAAERAAGRAKQPVLARTYIGQLRGRRYESATKLLGLPLIGIQARDPVPQDGEPQPPAVARGWIAIGDVAHGILLGIGGRATGLVAFGGMAMGGIAFGGCSIGVVAFGGAAVGGLAFGGGALGVLAVGGLALGGWAAGGMAVGLQALGGLALAWQAAEGGLAVARDVAVGGGAFAAQANTDAARTLVAEAPFLSTAKRWLPYTQYVAWAFAALAVAVSVLGWFVSYRRTAGAEST